MTINQVMGRTDWAMLAKQKASLVRLLMTPRTRRLGADDDLQGILNWIDAIQDAAKTEGFPVVFLTEDE